MKKQRIYISVFLLSLMLVIIIFFDFNYKIQERTTLISKNSLGIESLTVKNTNKGYTVFKKNNLVTVLGIDRNLINTAKCQKLLSSLLNLTINEIPEQSLKFKRQYGLQKPLATADINYYDINKEMDHIRINIGNEAPANLGSYAQLYGSGTVFILPKEVSDLLLGSQLEFISKEIFKDIANFEAADWQFDIFNLSKNEEIVLMKNAKKNAICFGSGNQKALLSDAVKKKIIDLLNLQALAIEKISPTLDDIDMYGLLTPYMQVKVSSGEKSELLKISAPKNGTCFVIPGNRNVMFKCNKTDILFLDDYGDYKDSLYKKNIVDSQEQDINSFIIKTKDKNIKIEKINGIWQLYINEKLSARKDSNKFIDEILLQLSQLELTNGELKVFDSSEAPKVSLEINYGNEQKDNYQFFIVEDNAYVTYKAYNVCFKVDKKALNEFYDILRVY